jgi:hypothetical protein
MPRRYAAPPRASFTQPTEEVSSSRQNPQAPRGGFYPDPARRRALAAARRLPATGSGGNEVLFEGALAW